jgi:hypothetical protein
MLLGRHLLVVLRVCLLDHLRWGVLHKLLAVLPCFMLGYLPIGSLIRLVGVLLVHVLLILIKWPHVRLLPYRPLEKERRASLSVVLLSQS